MRTTRRRAIIKALYGEIVKYRLSYAGRIGGRRKYFMLKEDLNKAKRIIYKIKYQKQLLEIKKKGLKK